MRPLPSLVILKASLAAPLPLETSPFLTALPSLETLPFLAASPSICNVTFTSPGIALTASVAFRLRYSAAYSSLTPALLAVITFKSPANAREPPVAIPARSNITILFLIITKSYCTARRATYHCKISDFATSHWRSFRINPTRSGLLLAESFFARLAVPSPERRY